MAVVLFVMYATIVLGNAFPVRLLSPDWQLKMLTSCLNAAGFPLVGLGLLHLAADLSPADDKLSRWRRLCAWLAVPVAVGFLLLIPLQSMALWQQDNAVYDYRLVQLKKAEQQLTLLRNAVESADNAPDLQQRLQSLKGPTLGPLELAMPFPKLKAQAKLAIEQFEARLRPGPSRNLQFVVAASLRNGIGCLALAFGFAVLGQGMRSPFTFWDDLIEACRRFRFRRHPRNGRKLGRRDEGLVDYIQEISRSKK